MNTLVLRGEQVRDAASALDRSTELLRAVADGTIAEDRVVRVYSPPPTVALSRRESHLPGFDRATAAAADHGFTPVVRPTGGRAVAYDESCIVFDLVEREHGQAAPSLLFARAGAALVSALSSLGADARVGDVPGEYCPGEFSINARGAVKLVGTSQRSVRGARLLSGMVPLSAVDHLVDVLSEVNAALGLEWDAATFGTLRDEASRVRRVVVEDALIGALAGMGR
ncbi:lipoate--protein ligase family protein [Microbacterium sp.]|uniref:lipoate--protein ligase family protein n=1 Tax=Microbacterium sp. TaxID=51671 RepID=UPI003A931261